MGYFLNQTDNVEIFFGGEKKFYILRILILSMI